ncbi:MAG: RecX family transcriptional regulator [Bacilli bacterium]|nr:RecX family transcriptional regulator [Bacilli bacterium]
MKIGKYTKLKSNKYSVVIDDITVKLYDDVIVKYELLRLKEIDDKLFKEITEYNDRLEAYYKSLKYITKKLRTEKEIYKYLDKDYSKEIILETIDKLKRMGYLNKELYLKSYLSDQVHMSLNGPNKIKKDLVSLGYDEDEIKESIESIDNDIWLDKVQKIVNKKIKSNRNLGSNKLKEKLVYDLGNMGYYKWMIEDIIHSTEFSSDSNILEKEYNKLYARLSRKFDGSSIDYQIRMKLLQKGFYSSEIDEFMQNKKNS